MTAELDQFYSKPDPWGFQAHPDDADRKSRILAALQGRWFERALDVGAGEGWITKDLPANEIHAIEASALAASRFPGNVCRVKQPKGQYDLVIATGVLYPHYGGARLVEMVVACASHVVVTCNIAAWEVPEVQHIPGQLEVFEFPYREYVQRLRLFEVGGGCAA